MIIPANNKKMNVICSSDSDMLLDVTHIKLSQGETFQDQGHEERAFLLITGEITVRLDGKDYHVSRRSCFDDDPIVFHLSQDTPIFITACQDSELCIEGCPNDNDFKPVVYMEGDSMLSRPAENTLDGMADRIIRTVFDGDSAPYSNMVLGEVVGLPGRWASYPPHDHPHPEVYLYKFLPDNGYGISIIEDDASIVRSDYASLIPGLKTHSQVAAPGYAMYYVWMIPHLKGNRWLQTTRNYRKEFEWVLTNPRLWHPAR